VGRPPARSVLLAAALCAFTAALFANSLSNGFAHDDGPLILKNPFLLDLGNLGRFFRSDYWAPTLVSGLYRPLVTSSYAVDVAIGGLEPLGFHVVNVALHAGVSVLVLLLLLRLVGDVALATATAFLFAAHAVHTEVVANVTAGRPELMAAFALLLSLHAHLSGRRLAALTAFLAALLCKESAVAWIGVVFLTDLVYGEPGQRLSRIRVRRVLRERLLRVYGPYAAVLLVAVGIRLLALGIEPALPPPRILDNPLAPLPAPWRAVNAVAVLGRYGWLLLFPLRLSYDYSWAEIPLLTAGDPRLALVLAGAAGFGAALAVAWRRSPDLFYALGFSLVTLSPVSNLVLPIGTIMAERLLYLPSVGFCLGLALGLRRLAGALFASRARAFAVLTGLVVALHGLRAVERNTDWRSEDAIWLHDVEVVPRSARAQSNAGAALERQGRCAEALPRFEAAIASGLPPEHFVHPYQGKALCLAELGRYREAAELYAEVVRHGPRHPELELRIELGLRRDAGAP
jgi:hypothetical protein